MSKDSILEVAGATRIPSAFVEKDLVIVRVMKAVGAFQVDGVSFVLGGGTSLSKAYGIIKRFSEDLDFKVINSKNITKSKRREIRHAFIDEIGKIDGFSVESVKTRNEGKICSFEVKYPNIADIPSFLRRILLIELFFDKEDIEIESKQVRSFVSEYMNSDFDAELNCVHPFFTAVGKFSGLMWRLFEDGSPTDYTLLRHLHDLYALSGYCEDEGKFTSKVLEIFETIDSKRIENKVSFGDVVRCTCDKLSNSPIYKEEYKKYVNSMSYAPDDERVPYDVALSHLLRIAKYFT
jgi:hypothetical protein